MVSVWGVSSKAGEFSSGWPHGYRISATVRAGSERLPLAFSRNWNFPNRPVWMAAFQHPDLALAKWEIADALLDLSLSGVFASGAIHAPYRSPSLGRIGDFMSTGFGELFVHPDMFDGLRCGGDERLGAFELAVDWYNHNISSGQNDVLAAWKKCPVPHKSYFKRLIEYIERDDVLISPENKVVFVERARVWDRAVNSGERVNPFEVVLP